MLDYFFYTLIISALLFCWDSMMIALRAYSSPLLDNNVTNTLECDPYFGSGRYIRLRFAAFYP